MDILFHVATEGGARILLPLAQACGRGGHAFGAFFTNEGVRGLLDAGLQAALQDSQAVVCDESWRQFCGKFTCPFELRSQAANSALMGKAKKVVSL